METSAKPIAILPAGAGGIGAPLAGTAWAATGADDKAGRGGLETEFDGDGTFPGIILIAERAGGLGTFDTGGDDVVIIGKAPTFLGTVVGKSLAGSGTTTGKNGSAETDTDGIADETADSFGADGG